MIEGPFSAAPSLLPLASAAGGMGLAATPASAQTPIKRIGGAKLKISLNAYSFAKRLNDGLRGQAGGITLLDLLDFCAKYDFEAIDPTGYYFPGYGSVRLGNNGVPTDDYIRAFKCRAFELGIAISPCLTTVGLSNGGFLEFSRVQEVIFQKSVVTIS